MVACNIKKMVMLFTNGAFALIALMLRQLKMSISIDPSKKIFRELFPATFNYRMKECVLSHTLMHLSILSLRVGGGGATPGNLIHIAFPWVGILTLGRAQRREFDMSAILEDRENLEISHPQSYPHTSQSTLYWNCLFSNYPFFLFPFSSLFLNHNCTYFISTIYHLLYVICILFFFF